ncbi:hypothetical protein WICMUC_000597 [Wickerhamomyces mucosus]|uniref:1,3-beta-glucanosyltransferase n=1 Tax=Wickerhamomyces mucosus TaxID=1378264 RepID=A0A9P8PYY6_9ASCO|nr:hypothetical protein WICMUC_000597 [Wickerhamomyces mucosus]
MVWRSLLLLLLVFALVMPVAYSKLNSTVEDFVSQQPEINSTIEIYGSKFFMKSTGEQFFIKGIAYQPSVAEGDNSQNRYTRSKFIDPMAEKDICLRDLPYLQRLGINTVRVYSIDPERNHDECFGAFAKAGIYVISDLSEPDTSISRKDPSWDVEIFERYIKVVDSLNKYDNLLGFFAGNEVTNDKTNTDASPFVKASIRDIKNHIQEQGYRKIPVGYSTNDDSETRKNLADYFACEPDNSTADFYGINMYEWCGYSTYWASGYRERTNEFKDYPIPVFFSEFGCNTKRPRPFTEVEALYGEWMTDIWSGGIAYMYFEESNEYGIVEVVQGELNVLPDFENLKKQFQASEPKGISLKEYQDKAYMMKTPTCPSNSKNWEASEYLAPTPDSVKCYCMENSLQCKLSPYAKADELGKIFKYACGIIDCDDIKTDGRKGDYGPFSDCSSRQKASYVINELFMRHGGDHKYCDFNGLAVLNSKILSPSELKTYDTLNGDSCAEFLDQHSVAKTARETGSKAPSSPNSTQRGRSNAVFSNRAVKLQFYSQLLNAIGLCSVLVFVFLFLG